MLRLAALLLAMVMVGAAPARSLAAWSAPVAVPASDNTIPDAQGAFGGAVLDVGERRVMIAKRAGEGFGRFVPLTVAHPFEDVADAALAEDGSAVVLTVRHHRPALDEIRATFIVPSGARSRPVTISERSHGVGFPQLAVASDGTAVAAWPRRGGRRWRVVAAVRLPGARRFGAPQTLSPAVAGLKGDSEPGIWIAAGLDGRAALAWQISGRDQTPLHVLTAAAGGRFGREQTMGDAGNASQAEFAISASGEVQLAYVDFLNFHFSEHPARSLHVAQGAAGAPLSAPVALSRGGAGITSGNELAAAVSADGTATVAWAKPGNAVETGGTLEVFTRPAGGAFGPPQTLAEGAEDLAVAGGLAASAVVAWTISRDYGTRESVHAATRPLAGGELAPPEQLSPPGADAGYLPSLALTPTGGLMAAWRMYRRDFTSEIVAAFYTPD